MAIVVGTNTWGTVDEADSYFDKRYASALWFTLPTGGVAGEDEGTMTKESMLVTAFYWLLDDTLGLSASLTADAVKRAQFEAAYFLMKYALEYEKREALKASGVSQFEIENWSETIGELTKPERILSILANAGYTGGGNDVALLGGEYDE